MCSLSSSHSSQELDKLNEVRFQQGRRGVGDGQREKQAKSPPVKREHRLCEEQRLSKLEHREQRGCMVRGKVGGGR